METKEIKNIIIGFGKGGKTLAKFLATKGEEVLVIEKSNQMYGGTCINIACLPSKRLIIEAANGVEFTDAINGKNDMTAFLRNANYHMLADEKTVTVLDGTAKFLNNHEKKSLSKTVLKTITVASAFSLTLVPCLTMLQFQVWLTALR